MVRFTLRALGYFSAVAQHGGIAQAARAVQMSQPAIASAIDKLEDTLGIKLLVRHHSRGAELTAQGREVLTYARRLLSMAEDTDRELQAIAADVTGHLRLGCFYTLAPFYVPGFVKALRTRVPGISIDVTEGRLDEMVSALQTRSVDVALIYALYLDPEALDWEVVKTLNSYVLLAADHPLVMENRISIADLANDPYIALDWPMTSTYFSSILAAAGVAPEIGLRSQSYEVVRGAVANGLGFSLLTTRPQSDVSYDGRPLVCRPIKEAVPPMDIVMAWSRAAGRSSMLDLVLQVSQEFFAAAEF